MPRTRALFYRITDGIRITVRPIFLPEQSRPQQKHFVFAYFVRIENVGQQTVQLLTRRWLIHDSIGQDSEVQGDGVVGEQPVIPPGKVHEYQSFCVLQSEAGHMEGSYTFQRGDGQRFQAAIPRFILDAQENASR
ncbi:MAG: Co2+/Mg2+ efflux protein ApaG [Gemmatimonadales bacterium]|nr:Co2+/Mg2+ efflux protein ApaG [Gemmatimonadales bacterium]